MPSSLISSARPAVTVLTGSAIFLMKTVPASTAIKEAAAAARYIIFFISTASLRIIFVGMEQIMYQSPLVALIVERFSLPVMTDMSLPLTSFRTVSGMVFPTVSFSTDEYIILYELSVSLTAISLSASGFSRTLSSSAV